MLDVSSYGYKAEITINEVEQEEALNKSYSGLLEKGLRKGKNSIVIRFTKTDDQTAFKPGVTIRSVTNDHKSKPNFHRIFR
jgi:phosphotransferase system HPr-like phosphotransfer protein